MAIDLKQYGNLAEKLYNYTKANSNLEYALSDEFAGVLHTEDRLMQFLPDQYFLSESGKEEEIRRIVANEGYTTNLESLTENTDENIVHMVSKRSISRLKPDKVLDKLMGLLPNEGYSDEEVIRKHGDLYELGAVAASEDINQMRQLFFNKYAPNEWRRTLSIALSHPRDGVQVTQHAYQMAIQNVKEELKYLFSNTIKGIKKRFLNKGKLKGYATGAMEKTFNSLPIRNEQGLPVKALMVAQEYLGKPINEQRRRD